MPQISEYSEGLPRAVDERFMRFALCQARRGLGSTSPNPAVGAIIVQAGEVIATGFHERAGEPHAEINALSKLSSLDRSNGATLYVTLEPCSTHGRTPPCTEAIVRAGIARVVIGAIDPNPRHSGRGVDLLRQTGLDVTTGILESECTNLNVGFNKWIVTKTPWVIAKVAQTLDGRITRPPAESQQLSNKRSQRLTHYLRSTVDAIMVGGETVRRDDPQLTIRLVHSQNQPWRVIATRSGEIPRTAKVFTDRFANRTLVYQGKSWSEIFAELGDRGVTRLLVEGGGEVLGDLLDKREIDEIWCFLTPYLVGGDKPSFAGVGIDRYEEAIAIETTRYKQIGNDLLIRGRVRR
jgi:diaminohydroxyphosphoribosylaminopyrimidine deaminase/5-amino-6-(5-phosphoribosylamino)uracil reductase